MSSENILKQLEGKHAFLSGSNYHWIRYSDDKLIEIWNNHKAKELGTRLHEFAENSIKLGIRLARNGKTLNMYVNDAISFRMDPEVLCYYSPYAFGWADALYFNPDKKILRIHDLKTGKTPASMDQLKIYAAFYSLDHDLDPYQMTYILRIYQNDEVLEEVYTDGQTIKNIMDTAIRFDAIISGIDND